MNAIVIFAYFSSPWSGTLALLYDTFFDNCLPRWTHRGEDGQYNWCCKVTHQCCQGNQSPINIDTRNASRIEECLKTEFIRCYPDSFGIFNNGHNVEVQGRFVTTNRPSMGDYEFDRIVFKFGHNSSQGSEHTLNNMRMPGEMQIIFKDKKYGSIQEAKKHPYGVQMWSFFIAISPQDNPFFNSLLYVKNKNDRLCIVKHSIGEFLPRRMSYFYQYEGSLTEPPCTYPVNWTVFHNPIYMSEDQFKFLRKMHTNVAGEECPEGDDCMMYNNFRRQQCRNQRPIYYGKDCGVHDYQRH
ncbi:Carbonic AnHydrase [Chamberlinius hualienensis]